MNRNLVIEGCPLLKRLEQLPTEFQLFILDDVYEVLKTRIEMFEKIQRKSQLKEERIFVQHI